MMPIVYPLTALILFLLWMGILIADKNNYRQLTLSRILNEEKEKQNIIKLREDNYPFE